MQVFQIGLANVVTLRHAQHFVYLKSFRGCSLENYSRR